MSADRLFCYAKQRPAVVNFLRHLGAPVEPHSPQAVQGPEDLDGLRHITFVDVRDHECPVPDSIWKALLRHGAIVVEFPQWSDDSLVRDFRLRVHHHVGERHDGSR